MKRILGYVVGVGAAAIIAADMFGCLGRAEYGLRGRGVALDVASKVEQIAAIEGKQSTDKKTGARTSTAYCKIKSGNFKLTVRNEREETSGCAASKQDSLEVRGYMKNFLLDQSDARFVDKGIDMRLDYTNTGFIGRILGNAASRIATPGEASQDGYKLLLGEANQTLDDKLAKLKRK